MMNIDLSLKQETKLSPQMQQFFAILQANNQELGQLIAQEISVNPVLEYQMDKVDLSNSSDIGELTDSLDEDNWSDDDISLDAVEDSVFSDWGDVDGESREQAIIAPSSSNSEQNFTDSVYDFTYDSISADQSLQEHLIQQVMTLNLEPELVENCSYLIGCLDERGYFDENADFLAKNIPHQSLFESALATIRDLDPVGVGAFDLQSCLIIQLETLIGITENLTNKSAIQLAYKIIKNEFNKLSKHQYTALSQSLEASESDLEESLALIRTLNPAPGLSYASNSSTEFLVPDIHLKWQEDGGYKLELDQDFIPQLTINQQYKQLALSPHESADSIKFLKSQVQNAKFWMYAINQRQQTLLTIAQVIVETQLDYLKGVGPLVPLSMQDIASQLDIHQTTVSRSIVAKSLKTADHIYPLKSLLSKAYELKSGEHIALDTILVKIKQLISKESPISDKKIAELLSQLGYDIPIRTVSHYREKLGYLPAHLRTTR